MPGAGSLHHLCSARAASVQKGQTLVVCLTGSVTMFNACFFFFFLEGNSDWESLAMGQQPEGHLSSRALW